MRKLYWYLTAYIKKHGWVVVLSVLGAIVLFSFSIRTIISNLEKRQRTYIGLVGQYSLSNLPLTVKQQLSVGLTDIQADGSVVPLLAERWSIEQEGTTYRFLLKEDILWQDGKAFTPEDIQYNLQDVETIITPNDIVFKLPGPYAPFPSVVAEPVLRASQQKYWFFFSRPTLIGIGEYHIQNYEEHGDRLTEITIDGDTERFIYKFYLTEEDAVAAFKHGEVDVLTDLAKQHDIMAWETTQTTATLETNKYLAVFFNIRSSLFPKNIRQGLSYALSKPQDETRAIGPINPQSWAYLQGGKTYDQDWERGSERMLAEPSQVPLTIELTTTSLFEAEAEQIKQEWEAFGQKVFEDCQTSSQVEDKSLCENQKISVDVRITNFPDTSNFEVLLIGQESSQDPDQYNLWHSAEASNFTGYKNTRIDNLLEKGRQTFNQQERREIYQEFQQFFLEDAPAIFMRYLYSYEVERQ